VLRDGITYFYASDRVKWLLETLRSWVVRSSVAELAITIFWKWINHFSSHIDTSGLRGKGMKQSTLRVKGQGHTRPKIDLEPWRRHHFGPCLGQVAFLVSCCVYLLWLVGVMLPVVTLLFRCYSRWCSDQLHCVALLQRAVCATAILSITLYVCHTCMLCQNSYTYPQTFYQLVVTPSLLTAYIFIHFYKGSLLPGADYEKFPVSDQFMAVFWKQYVMCTNRKS